MELLVIVLNKTEFLTDLLDGFVEEGIKGATIVDSAGMGHVIASHFPLFSSFAQLMKDDDKHSKMIFTVVDSCGERDKAVKVVESVIGDIEKPDTAFLFSLPVSFVKGIAFRDCGGK